MSDGYLTPKKTPLQWAASRLSDAAFKTFMVEFSHVNDIGTCYPGYQTLSDITHHEKTCVWLEMQEIFALDLVRQIEAPQRDKYGRWSAALYQVNPNFMYIRPDKLAEATALWNSVEQTIEQKVPVQSLPSKVPLESAAESTALNSFSESAESNSFSKQQQQQSKVPFEGEMQNAGYDAKWLSQRAAPHQEPEKPKPPQQREAQPTKTSVPPPPAGKYPDITPVPRALSMGHEEELALNIGALVQMPIRLARGLITMYGYNVVATAYADPFVAMAHNPAGALRSLLQRQQRVEPLEVATDERIDSFLNPPPTKHEIQY